MSDQQIDHADFGPVRIAATEVAEMDGPRRLVRVPKAEIVGLELVSAVGAERPILTLIVGIALVALGLFPWAFLLLVLTRGGHMRTTLFWFTPFALLGAWMIWFACKVRLVLLVRTARDVRKVVFPAASSRKAAERFTSDAAHRFDYSFSGFRERS